MILLNEFNIKNIPTQKQFEQWLNIIVETIPEKIPKNTDELCISIVDSDTSAHLNKTYRKKNRPTNLLFFPYESIPGIIQTSLGDLAICADIVEKEATEQHKKAQSHWAHMTIHGILHLLGYDHIIDNDAEKMETLEIKILKKLHIENPYA